jgi:hypothetical protein
MGRKAVDRLPYGDWVTREITHPIQYTGQEPKVTTHTFDICPVCKAEMMRGIYAIAQMAMGHQLTATCPNGHQFNVRR